MSRIMKLFGLVSGIVLLDIILLSPGLFGVRIGGDNVLETAFGVTFVVMSVVVLLYGSYGLLIKPSTASTTRDIVSPDDYIQAFRRYKSLKAFKTEIASAIDQIDRMEKRKSALFDLLRQMFDPGELSYKRFSSVIHEVNHLFNLNIRGILNKLNVYDAAEYDKFTGTRRPDEIANKLIKEREGLYQEYLTYVSGSVLANEEILLKLDKLLLEISRLDSTDYKAIEAMPGMKEIDALIQQTKFYKQ